MLRQILRHKVFKNFSYLTAGTIVAQLLSLVTILRITHILNPGGYGIFSFLIVQGTLLLNISDLGIRNIVIRSIARDPQRARDMIVNGARIRSVAMIVLIVLYLAYNHFLGTLTLLQVMLLFAYSYASCLANMLENTFIGNQKMLIPSVVNMTNSLLWLIAVYILPLSRTNIDSLFTIYVIVAILKVITFYFFLKKSHLLIGKVENFRTASVRIIKESWPYFVLVLLMLPFSALSNNFLALNAKPEQLGYFNLALRLLGPVSLVIDVGLAAIFPNLSSLWAKDEDQFYSFISVAFKYFMMLALILCFLFTLFTQDIVKLLFSAKYLPAVKVSQLLIWYIFLTTVDSLMGTILGAINKEKVILKFGIYKALFCTPFLYIGSMYGALGLAYGYVISLALFNIYLWIGFKRALNSRISKVAILWFFSGAGFLISYFIQPANTFIIRFAMALAAIGFTGFYISKNYKSAM